jgi:hypothetical protein
VQRLGRLPDPRCRDIASGEEITCNDADFEPEFEMLPSLVNAFHRHAFVHDARL